MFLKAQSGLKYKQDIFFMYKEYEIRKNFNNDNNYWKRVKDNGVIEYYSKDFYDNEFNRIEEKLLREIEEELCN